MNNTPRGERVHIGIFGRRNAGKSSLLNAVTGQSSAIVSPVKGTTTDPVYKAMELLPIGPVTLIDTPGIDDTGDLGGLRTDRAKKILQKTDIALLVVDSAEGLNEHDRELIRAFEEADVRYLIVYNKCDVAACETTGGIGVSAKTGANINELKERIAKIGETNGDPCQLIADLLRPNDVVVLVVPIDEGAPKGRLILPQQQVIRDALEAQAVCVITQPQGLKDTLNNLPNPPKLVITDSQVFAEAAKLTPANVALTSFSILMARYKGVLDDAVKGVRAINHLKSGDKVLIAEGCTHHRQCEDIGTVKIPRWLEKHTGAKPEYTFCSGTDFPDDLSHYSLIIHCGGCIQNVREMRRRLHAARYAEVPMTNYGIAISHMQGILARCVELLV